MSDRGSPSDRTENVDANVDGGAPAGAPAAASADASGSGDANLSAAPSSGDGEQGAKEAAPKPTLADVIKTAAELPAADATGKSPDPAKDGKDKVEGAADGAQPGDKAEADDSKLPFHNHPRWKEVIGQNKTLTDRVSTLEPDANEFGKIKNFMTEKNLTHEEVGEGFIIMAMLKNGDPRGLQKLDEYRDKLAEVLGEKIPKDIQDQIDSGAITEDAGKELSRTRAGKAKSDADLARVSEANTERDNKEAAERSANEFNSAVNGWAVEAKKTDPDFAKKEPAIARYAHALMLERGHPTTRDEAVKLVKDAYKEVNETFAAALPQKEASRHVPIAPSNNGAKPAPKNLGDVVRQAAAL